MRILMAHNYYQQPGGEDEVFTTETAMLMDHGHTVVQHTCHNDELYRHSKISIVINTIFNHNKYRQLRFLIRKHDIEIVHCQNIFPMMSPAVYYAAKKERVPVVQTLHNFKLICPGTCLFRD